MEGESEPAREVFRRIYEADHWKGGSGEGSVVAATAEYRRVLGALVAARDVRTVVDAGCGDWQFSHLVDWSGVRYRGFDVVPELVERNRREHGTNGVAFDIADVRCVELPKADLLVCKDVLQHWDNASIRSFLERNVRRYRYLLLTNDVASVHAAAESLNADLPLGHWRPLDLERAPFALRADWRFDFDVRGEWTKRSLLVAGRRSRLLAALLPGSGLRACRRLGRTP